MKLKDFELELSEADIEKIRLACENPPEPNEALIVAARKYKLALFEKMAEEAWEGCDGCDENDKQFFISGFVTALFSTGYELK
jgi:hypothetical protein